MYKLVICAALSAAMACGSARADDASKRAKIDQLFSAMHMQQAMEQLAAQQQKQIKEMMPGMFPDLHPTPAQQKQLDALMVRVNDITRESLAWNKLEPQFVDLYAATYDEPTIDGILGFYNSAAGKTMIAKQPELIAKSQGITQKSLEDMQPKMRAVFQDFLQEVQKEQPADSKTPGAAAK